MKVFLSSTAQDLVAHRQVADDTILRLSGESVVMERFGPLPGEPVGECERKARESDVVACIVAHRYGFVPEQGRGSITRREVEAAHAAGKDVLVWIVADDHPWTEKREQDRLTDPTVLADPAKIAEVADGVRALGEFKAWLRESFTAETFTTPDDLGRKIAIALKTRASGQAPRRQSVPTRGEVRIVHALQPAPHFHGRDALLKELKDWVADLASPDRVWSLVAAGGTGKTAVAERVVREMNPGEANVLVWSFYEKPDADAFLRECNQLFLGEESGPAGGRLERLERGLRDGRPHLIVLDGLERVQEEAGGGRVRGELSDHTLRLLLRALAAGLGRARALVTSRFPLIDLQDWTHRGYRDSRLDDLPPDAAVAVLRDWGVTGDEVELRAAAAQVGNHALSVAVIGSYLRSFADGYIDAVEEFDLNAITGADPKAAKLARVLASYAEKLPSEERDLLARVSIFPRGVTLPLLGTLIDVGGEVAGLLVNARPRLSVLLKSLKERGLVFAYSGADQVAWTAHPFLRESFRALLNIPPEQVFNVVAGALGAGLETAPATKPIDAAVLDRYEQLIEATRLAGREQDAFDLYWYGMGGYTHLGWTLGEYQRGYRILAAFSRSGHPEDLAPTMVVREREMLATALALYAHNLGRLKEASARHLAANQWAESLGDHGDIATGIRNSAEVSLALGDLIGARALADAAIHEANLFGDPIHLKKSHAYRAISTHLLGDIDGARADFAAAIALEKGDPESLLAQWLVRHLLDLGDLASARTFCEYGMRAAQRYNWNHEFPAFHALLARIALAEEKDPLPHIVEVLAWTARTGEMQHTIQGHVLAARHLLVAGDPQSSLGEAETGLLHAVSCGFGLLRIELLTTLARTWLAWPDPGRAIQAAREALDLATHPDCQYAWGEADAAQAWGEAYFANHEPTLARRAFTRALEVRRRIEHPGVGDTEMWLARVS